MRRILTVDYLLQLSNIVEGNELFELLCWGLFVGGGDVIVIFFIIKIQSFASDLLGIHLLFAIKL